MAENYIVQSFVLTDKNKWIDLDKKLPGEGIPKKMFWVHMQCDSPKTESWLRQQEGIEDFAMEGLLAEDTRPRVSILSNGYFINLRGINLNREEEPHDMVSIRMFVQENRIISTSKKMLHVIDDMADLLKTDTAPVSSGGLITSILDILVDRAEDYIIELKDKTYELEYEIIDRAEINQRRHITDIRHSVITLTRYFSPQKDAASKLLTIKGSLFTLTQERDITECINKLHKCIEDLDSLDNRCYVLQDEVAAITNEKINRKMYYISVMATVFLPITFLTGLFGINVGGIPFARDGSGFFKFIVILVLVVIIQTIMLVKSKKF